MSTDGLEYRDTFVAALDMARELPTDGVGLVGYGVAVLTDRRPEMDYIAQQTKTIPLDQLFPEHASAPAFHKDPLLGLTVPDALPEWVLAEAYDIASDKQSHTPELLVPFANLITDAGDLYIAGKVIAAIAPASPAAPTAASGMKLGTGTTAVTKAGAAAALITYLTGSNAAFDATFPSTSNLGSGLGVNSVYKTTWAAGVATNSAITEAVIANDAGTNATSSAANTYSRVVFTAINKTATDSLAITWNWKALGA